MTTLFHRFGLRAKLALGFVVLIGLMLTAGSIALLSHRNSLGAVDRYLEGEHLVNELALKSSAAFGKARRYEKEFLLKVKEFGYEEARSRYATLVRSQLADVRANMAEIRRLGVDPVLAEDARAVEETLVRYETGFLETVELYGHLGRYNSGLEARLRARAHRIEAMLTEGAPLLLMTGLLTMRRAEKDFIMRGRQQDIEAFERTAEDFRRAVARAGLPARREGELLRLAGEYRGIFGEYVATTVAIEAATLAYLEAAHTVEPRLGRLYATAERAASLTLHAAHEVNQVTTWVVTTAGLAAILLALMVGMFVVRSVSRSVRELVSFAGRLAEGDLGARLPQGNDRDFDVVVDALNRGAGALQEAQRRDMERTAELGRLNRTLRMLSQCNEALVHAASEQELLDAICRRIVEVGGHRMTWVGFAREDEDRSVEPVAHAGSDRDYVDALHITWGDDRIRRGMGGTAILENRAVVVRQIAEDPIFEPWREEALRRGFASCISLPLRGRDGCIGCLSIYAEDPDAFDEQEVKLLQELADDLAYGILSLREARERERVEQALDYQSNHDTVTGLANRYLFLDRLGQTIVHAGRANRQAALLLFDLDRFKAVNDSLGHGAGDTLLRHVGKRLVASLREGDTVARLSGDEFAVALSDVAKPEDVAPIARKLLTAIKAPLLLNEREVRTSASLGISLFPRDGDNPENLLQNADAAMYSAKSLGGDSFHFYAPEMNERMLARFALEADLRRAVERGELLLHYQPKVNLATGEPTGAEALLRWRHPERGLVPPGDFISLAEETGLIVQIGEWVIEAVCEQVREWLDAGLAVPPVALNLSARQFHQQNLVAVIRQALRLNQIEAKCLELEITESILMDNVEKAVTTLQELKSVGLKIALDDFGTGYSSLSYLKRFPIDHLKIDRAFVRDVTSEPDDAAICLAVIGLAHNLKLKVVAEGVETEAQMNYLRTHGCDEIQGFYFSRPLPATEFAQLLTQHKVFALPSPMAGERKTLLLVDDEPNILSALKRLLRRDGYEILAAGSAKEGFELLATHEVQVILSDQRMPEMNGTEFLARVREIYPETIRIVLSGYTDLDSVTEAINRGSIYRFLTKPWDDDMLRQHVREAFRHYGAARRTLTEPV
ncbi:MAG: EAL domain-containing protein [Rhodocyclales bacterium]|nr:EAL domain-containing protein [Rhodocyclales bacterium]